MWNFVFNLIGWLIIGGLAGWLANAVMKTGRARGLWWDIGLGLVGAVIGGYLVRLAGLNVDFTGPINLPSLGIAFLGAIVLLGLLRFVWGPKAAA